MKLSPDGSAQDPRHSKSGWRPSPRIVPMAQLVALLPLKEKVPCSSHGGDTWGCSSVIERRFVKARVRGLIPRIPSSVVRKQLVMGSIDRP